MADSSFELSSTKTHFSMNFTWIKNHMCIILQSRLFGFLFYFSTSFWANIQFSLNYFLVTEIYDLLFNLKPVFFFSFQVPGSFICCRSPHLSGQNLWCYYSLEPRECHWCLLRDLFKRAGPRLRKTCLIRTLHHFYSLSVVNSGHIEI